ncbi:MAG: HD domain-containing protein [Candidatus Dojkabacteria bacterium]
MQLTDRIYGTFEMDSPILLELLATPEVLRLKKISQLGVPDKYFHIKGFSRYEHSVGVMLLLKKLGASEKEQIAGLLHDVSHTVFSHVIDWVIADSSTEGYQDSQHERILKESSLNSTLKKYGYDYQEIADLGSFTLLDSHIPNVCVDRIDYSLRQFPKEVIKDIVANFSVLEDKIVFKDRDSAKLFAENFLDQQVNSWGSANNAYRYALLAKAIKAALDEGILTEDDFWAEEDLVLEKIENKSKNAQKWLDVLKMEDIMDLPTSEQLTYKKFRYVDPLFQKEDGTLVHLTEIDLDFKNKLEKAREENKKGIKLLSILSD